MSLFLVLLAAGDSKRLKSNTPNPYYVVNNKTILEHSLDAFRNFDEIKRTIIVFNKKHKNRLNKLNLNETFDDEYSTSILIGDYINKLEQIEKRMKEALWQGL